MNSLSQDQMDAMISAAGGNTSQPTGSLQMSNKVNMPGALSKDQLDALVNAGLSASQSAAVLGHATSQAQKFISPGSPQSMQPTNSLENIKDLGIGAIKSFGDTAVGAARFGNEVANQTAGRVVNAVQGKGFTPLSNDQLGTNDIGNSEGQLNKNLDTNLAATNDAQSVGKFAGNVAQAFIPVGDVAKGGIAAESIAGKGIEAVKGGLKQLSDTTGLTKFLADRAMNKTINAVAPKLTAGEIEASPNVVRPTFGAPGVDFTKDKALQGIAADTQDIVKGKSAIDDKNALQSAIKNTSEQEVKPFLAENKSPANFEDLQKKLSLVQPQSSLKADPNAIKTYDRVREEVQQNLYNSLKQTAKEKGDFTGNVDFNDVWDARKVLDTKAEEELGTKVFGTPEFTGAKAAIQDMRQGLTQYIKDSLQFPGQMEDVNRMQEFTQVARSRGIDIGSSESKGLMEQMGIKSTPEGIAKAQKFENAMSKISNYYKAVDNISTKVPDEIRANATFGKRHPILKWVGRGLGVGTGIGIEEQARKAI